MSLMFAIVELSRGHSESAVKSERGLANWDRALRLAREEGRLITRRLPAWVGVDDDDGLPCLVQERAAAIRCIFEWATAGYGMTRIVKRLNDEGVPAFCAREDDGEGYYRKVDGVPFGCGEWTTTYVRAILTDRRVLGELQPYDYEGKKKGEPIKGYYPPVVTEDEFYAARAAVANRKTCPDTKTSANRQGAIGKGVANLFGGLLRNARDGSTYFAGTRVDRSCRDRPHRRKQQQGQGQGQQKQKRTRSGGGKVYVTRVLRSRAGVEGRGPNHTFPYAVFEWATLRYLRELNPAEVLGQQAGPADAKVIQGELDWVRQRRDEMAEAMDREGQIAVVVRKLAELRDREAELRAKLEDAQARAVTPLAETFREAQDLAALLDATPPEEMEDRRLRLRAALRRVVDSIWLLVVPRGRDKLLGVQIYFQGGGRREYLVWYRGLQANQNGRDEGWFKVRSMPTPNFEEGSPVYGLVPTELRDLTMALEEEQWLRDLSDEDLAGPVFGKCEAHPLP
jgi:Recombinase